MLIDLPQNVLKAVLIFVSPLDILRLRKVCRQLYNFIKVCRRQLPKMPGVESLMILAPSTDDSDLWKFVVDTLAKPDEQESDEWKIHGVNSLNLPVEEIVGENRICTVPTSRLNEMVQELCQFRHSNLHIGGFDNLKLIWTDLECLLQLLIDVYEEWPVLRPGIVYFRSVDFTTVVIDHWRAFLAKINTKSFQMIGCTIPHLDYGLPSISASRLLNSIHGYSEHFSSLTGTGQPDYSQTMDVLQNLMLRPPGMDEYKYIHLSNALPTASHWIGLIEAWQNGVDRVAVDSTAANKDHCSLVLVTDITYPHSNAIFRQMTQHLNCEDAGLVIGKPRSMQLLIVIEHALYIYLTLRRFAQPWNRQSRTLERMEEGWYKDKFIITDIINASMSAVYRKKVYLAVYRRMKELGIMTEKDRRFMSGEEDKELLDE